ncbi:flagellar hook-basal body complex protein FliE [Paludibacterium paludis]|uniref:Flagellar hook-basal body complex protein FliE n=1 Tax=Paludibacterium paludis TaxID=1225769 RepID=A0A918U7U7_9NEIS|nr:flagellar hook-basal body complex protein FliE [Paludibacterium paludis]GGY04587.1 flagellar hook-basal body complex protein FliE [Paludibacterium paludis]
MKSEIGGLILGDKATILGEMSRIGARAIAPAAQTLTGSSAAPVSFSDSLSAAVRSVDAAERKASDKVADVESGRSDDLVGAMLMTQEANLSFSALVQVRNKLVGAVDDLIKMPV